MVELSLRNLESHFVGGHVFQRVRFVKYRHLIIGKETSARSPHGQIAEKQGVIHHENMRGIHSAARLEIKTLAVIGTVPPEAIAAIALDRIPNRGRGLKWQVGPAAFLGGARPAADLRELLRV